MALILVFLGALAYVLVQNRGEERADKAGCAMGTLLYLALIPILLAVLLATMGGIAVTTEAHVEQYQIEHGYRVGR